MFAKYNVGRSGGEDRPLQILKAGLLYFALVFGAGFILGACRVRWVVPRFGTRTAERLETPIMLLVTVV